MNITAQCNKVSILVHDDPFKPALKKMTTPLILSINVNGIARIDVLHNLREIRLRGLD